MSSPIHGLGRRQSGLLFSIASVALLYGTGVAYSGPCTAQIADFEQQISSPASRSANWTDRSANASARNCITSQRPSRRPTG